jgi:PAS domain S-box-containing protein
MGRDVRDFAAPVRTTILGEDSIMSIPLEVEIGSRRADRPSGQPVLDDVARVHLTPTQAPPRRAAFADVGEDDTAVRHALQSADDPCELYDNAPCGYHSLDATGLIVRINDTELGWLGYARDEVVGRMRLQDLVPERYRGFFRHHFALLKEYGWQRDLEYEMRRKDGTTFPVLVNATAVNDASGRFVRSCATVLDISARKRLEGEIRESELRSTANLRAAFDCVVSVDERGVIIEFNPAAERTFGYTREQAVGREVFKMIVPPAMRGAYRRGLERYLATREASMLCRRVEVTAMRSDGAEFPAELTVIPVPLRDRTAFTAYLRDITREKWALQELRRYSGELRAVSRRLIEVQEADRRALAGQLHDLVGQKLTALNINLNALKGESPPPVMTARGSARLEDSLKLVEETVDCIRRVMTELRPVVLDDFGLAPALHWYARQFIDQTGVAATVMEHGPRRRLPRTAEDMFFRIAQEALANIAKHAHAQEVTLALETTGKATCLGIADDGCGFDASARHDPSGDRGWGLTIMRERAAALGADLTIAAGPGRGTRITVTLRADASPGASRP